MTLTCSTDRCKFESIPGHGFGISARLLRKKHAISMYYLFASGKGFLACNLKQTGKRLEEHRALVR